MISGERKCKEIERKKSERNRTKNRAKQSENKAKTGLCETSQSRRILYEISTLLLNHSATHLTSLRKFFAAAKPSLAHECHFAAQEPPFRSCESAAKLQSVKIPIFTVKAPFRRVFRSCETKFGTRVPFRSTVTSLLKLQNGLRSGLRE